jgi:CrcB protein
MNYAIVFLGGGLGAVLRYLIGSIALLQNKSIWTHTLVANILAALILGVVSAMQVHQKWNVSSTQWLLIATGFCGGLSTFSTFSLEVVQWLQQGKWPLAFGYILLNVVLCTALIGMIHWITSHWA